MTKGGARLANLRGAPRAIALFAVLLSASGSAAEEEDLFERAKLTGDWGGVRTTLSDAGYGFFAQYLTGGFANTLGGRETGVRYTGFAQLGMNADLTRVAGWQDARFQIRWLSYHGGTPSSDLVGQFSAQNVSGTEADDSFVRFYTIYIEQLLFDGMLAIKGGQLAADDDFMVCRVCGIFVNATLGDTTSLADGLSVPIYPLAAPGLYAELHPTPSWIVRAGVYTGDTGEDESSNFGFDWGFDHEQGVVLAGEVGVRTRFFDRDGSVLAGVIGSTGRTADDERRRGLYGLYAIVDQDLLRDDRGRPVLAAFTRVGSGPQKNRALQRWFVDVGLIKYGVFAGQDSVGLALGYSRFSSDYVRDQRNAGQNVTRRQALIELTYQVQLTGWLSLQPDLQYFVGPHFSRDDALAVGLQAVIDF